MKPSSSLENGLDAPHPAREPESRSESPSGKRYRFTLKTLILATVLCGALFAFMRWAGWSYFVNDQVHRLGGQAGLWHDKDRSKVHLQAIETQEKFGWSWNAILPEGKQYRIRWAHNDIPVTGIREADNSPSHYVAGSAQFGYRIYKYRNQINGEELGIKHHFFVHNFNRGSGHNGHIFKGKVKWTEATPTTRELTVTPQEGEQPFAAEEVIVLVRLRDFQRSAKKVDQRPFDPSDGVLVWLEPVPVP